MELYKVKLTRVEVEALLLVVSDLVGQDVIPFDEALAPDSLMISSEVFQQGSTKEKSELDYELLANKLEALAQIMLTSTSIEMGMSIETLEVFMRGPSKMLCSYATGDGLLETTNLKEVRQVGPREF